MYSTSSEQTRVTWAAHSYNIAFSDEIGHFDFCDSVSVFGTCTGNEGSPGNLKPADGDDVFCFPAAASLLVQASGCEGTNTGFDGVSYQSVWPDGNETLHPTSVLFSSPVTGQGYNVNYNRMAFETDLPRVEFSTCNRDTGAGCTLIPQTDSGTRAAFYPFYTAAQQGSHCLWTLGNDIPELTTNDFGRNSQYGSLLKLTYTALGGGGTQRYNDFRQVLPTNPCVFNR